MWTIEDQMADKEFVASLPKSRVEAKSLGVNKYYTKPCIHGHDTYRHTVSGTCGTCSSLSAAKHRKALTPEVLASYNKKASDNWKASGGRKGARNTWTKNNPKSMWASMVLCGARQRAKGKDVAFNITKDYILSILPDNCPIFGTPFAFSGNKKICPESPSLDRIDPKLGYVVGNIAVISMKANVIKSSANVEEIQKVADWLKTKI